MSEAREAMEALVRRECAQRSLMDFGKFMEGVVGPEEWLYKPHLVRIADAYERLERREHPSGRVMVSIPVQHGKTALNTLFSAWYLARHPNHNLISTAYSEDLVSRNADDLQLLLNSERLPFPGISISPDSSAKWRFKLAPPHRGFVRSCSVGGAISGFSADLIIVDDPVKDMNEANSEKEMQTLRTWWTSTILSRIVNSTIVIVTGACFSQTDLIGYLLNGPGADTWEKHFYPAFAEKNCPLGRAEGEPLFPEKQSLELLLQKKREMPPSEWQAVYCCNPQNREGGVFVRSWFDRRFDVRIGEQRAMSGEASIIRRYAFEMGGYSELDRAYRKRIYRLSGVDAASTVSLFSSWTSTCTIECDEDGEDFYVLEVTRERVRFDGLKRRVRQTYYTWRPSLVLIEKASSGIPLVDELQLEAGIPVQDVSPHGSNKAARYDAVSGICEQHRIILPREAPWIEVFLSEMEIVSGRANEVNDQADSFCLTLKALNEQVAKRKAYRRTQEQFAVPWISR